jgi:RNA polymerase sigma-70 factor (ECF subfamily)
MLKLRSRLRSPAQVEDARQETFVRVLTTLKEKGGLASAESLGAFVNGVCNNVLFEMYRANARTTALDEEYDEASSGPSADFTLVADQEREEVRAALKELPEREQLLLTWLFFEERDKNDICRDLQIDRGYLRVLVHRAKSRFRERFALLSSR